MEIICIVLGSVCIVAGFVASFLPVLPGLPISYVGLLLLQFTSPAPFSFMFMLVWAAIVIGIMVLDNIIPVYGTKKFGGSVYGIWGSIAGMIAGIFFFPPFGIIVGPLIGAFLGELIGGKSSDRAFKSALGSFAGLLVNTLMKAIASGVMGYYFFISL